MNCWAARSTFQMANILMLIVAIPFLVCMIVIYIMFAFIFNKSGSCAVFCCYMYEGMLQEYHNEIPGKGTLRPATIVIEDYSAPRFVPTRSIDFPIEEHPLVNNAVNPSVAALFQSLYNDNRDETIFKCSAAVVGKQWALTVDECVGNNLSIRIGSNYWFKDGTVKQIRMVHPLERERKPSLVLLHFVGAEKDTQVVKIGKMSDPALQTFNWKSSLDRPLAKRQKFDQLKAFDVDLFQKDDCSEFEKPKHVSCYITHKNDFCGDKMNAPIMDSKNNLVGIHLQTICEEKKKFALVSYINVAYYSAKIKQIVNYAA